MRARALGATLAILVTVVLASGCGSGALSASDRAAVQEAWDAVAAADIAADLEATEALITDDFVHIDPRVAGPLSGRAEWRAWADSLDFGAGEGGYEVEEIGGSGSLAYVVWTGRSSWMQGGQRQEASFKGMSVFRKEADGSWKLARNAWNPTSSPMEGAWRTLESWGTNADGEWRTENVQPSVWIFRGRHYSIMFVRGDEARPLLGENATRESITNTQMRNTFMTFVANSGTFTVDGSTFTTDPDVALWPDFMETGTATYTFTVDGNTMTLTNEEDGNVWNYRLQRIE